jgi:acyl-CoA thioesterase FadM
MGVLSSLRLVRTVVQALCGARARLADESVVWFRVAPGDLDFNLHMNNGRYLTLMDYGRGDLAIRAGLFQPAWRNKWRPVLGSATIRFRRSLRPFQRFSLHTRLLGWDDRWFVFEQRFEAGGELYATALARALFIGKAGTIPPTEALAAIGLSGTSPPLPAYVADWAGADDAAWAAAQGRARQRMA